MTSSPEADPRMSCFVCCGRRDLGPGPLPKHAETLLGATRRGTNMSQHAMRLLPAGCCRWRVWFVQSCRQTAQGGLVTGSCQVQCQV